MAQKRAGLPITHEDLVPGVVSYASYLKRRATWDEIRQCIGLDGEFYEGAEILLFPPDWLNKAEQRADDLKGRYRRAGAMGVDSAMGGDNTSWAIVDSLGLMALESAKTPDTTEITSKTLTLMRQHGLQAEQILFDHGGGGKQHADRLRRMGYNVRLVHFGEAAKPEKRRVIGTLEQRKQEAEVRFAYRNRRAEMYHGLRLRLDPSEDGSFALPADIVNKPRSDGGPSLRRQLAPIPYWQDEEGTIFLPPKQRRSDQKEPGRNSPMKSLTEMIGCSPDEADALVLACYGLTRRFVKATAGAVR
jgi:hypothetical protein